MVGIVIKGSRYVKGKSLEDSWQHKKDQLHQERKNLEQDLRQTIFSRDKMNAHDCQTETEENRRVKEYDRWKQTKDSSGRTNEEKMRKWNEINREFKKHGEEGRLHSTDDLRQNKEVKYD